MALKMRRRGKAELTGLAEKSHVENEEGMRGSGGLLSVFALSNRMRGDRLRWKTAGPHAGVDLFVPFSCC